MFIFLEKGRPPEHSLSFGDSHLSGTGSRIRIGIIDGFVIEPNFVE